MIIVLAINYYNIIYLNDNNMTVTMIITYSIFIYNKMTIIQAGVQ